MLKIIVNCGGACTSAIGYLLSSADMQGNLKTAKKCCVTSCIVNISLVSRVACKHLVFNSYGMQF